MCLLGPGLPGPYTHAGKDGTSGYSIAGFEQTSTDSVSTLESNPAASPAVLVSHLFIITDSQLKDICMVDFFLIIHGDFFRLHDEVEVLGSIVCGAGAPPDLFLFLTSDGT